jgi:hypothetical protein
VIYVLNTEFLNDGTLIKHYSDAGMALIQNETGLIYSEAIDTVPCPYTYTETDQPIEPETEEISQEENN